MMGLKLNALSGVMALFGVLLSVEGQSHWRTAVLNCAAQELNRSRNGEQVNLAGDRLESNLQLGVECEMANEERSFSSACFRLMDEIWTCPDKELVNQEVALAQNVCAILEIPVQKLALPQMRHGEVEVKFRECRSRAIHLNELLDYKRTGRPSGDRSGS